MAKDKNVLISAASMTPIVSFIITYHNEPEELLQACIGSILALRLAPDEGEILVVDDGSETPCAMHDVRCAVFRQEQAGLSVARNTGISHARGRYIQFVDADDSLVPSAYEKVLEQLRRGEADVVIFHYRNNDARCTMCNAQCSPQSSYFVPRTYLQHRNLRAAACCYAFKRKILGDLRFCPGLLHEDELFTPLLLLRAESLLEMDVKAYFYRQHDGTITHSKSPEQVQKRLDDIHFIIRELHSSDNPFLERRIRQLTADYLQKIYTLTGSLHELRRRMSVLRQEGFLPLPLRCYSLRYLLIALMAKL